MGFICTGPRLHIINNKHVDGLVELDEIVGGVFQNSVNELHLKEMRADIQHPFLGIKLLGLHANGIHKVGFSTARGPIDEHGVELIGIGMLGDRQTNRTRQLVAIALDIVRKRLVRIELWVQLLFLGRLFFGFLPSAPCLGSLCGMCFGRVGLNVLGLFVFAINHHAVSKAYALTKSGEQHTA